MEQNQINQIKLAISYMDNDFWERVTNHSSNLSEKTVQITAAINKTFIKLGITQLEILNAKYKGYEHLLSSTESNLAEIIRENKNCIGELTEQKNQTATELLNLLADITAIIEEVRTLGEQ